MYCNLCGYNDYAVVSRIGYPFSRRVRNVICKRCTLVYQNPKPCSKSLYDYYADYRKRTIGIKRPTEDYEAYARPMAKYHYSFFKEYCKPGMNILDVGCGAGTLMSWAVKDGLNAYGVNPDRGFGNYGPKHYGLKEVQISMFEDSHFKESSLDIITLNHVFEHFIDATYTLEKIRAYLKKDGLIYLSIPNILTPHGQLEYNYAFEHMHTFSPTTIKLLLKKMGFKMVKFSDYGYVTDTGFYHPYIDLVARKIEVTVPQPIDWDREAPCYKKIIFFLRKYRKAFIKDKGRIRIYAGVLAVIVSDILRNKPILKKVFRNIKNITGNFIHIEPNYSTMPKIRDFPQERCQYYE